MINTDKIGLLLPKIKLNYVLRKHLPGKNVPKQATHCE